MRKQCLKCSAHLHRSHGSFACQSGVSLAGSRYSCSTLEGGQQVGYAKVRNHNMQWVQAIYKDVCGPQVPVQDAQSVQVQQGRGGLLQQGKGSDKCETTL